jgi:hypothetical protein
METREIPLTQGQVAIVSAHRYEQLMQWKWFATWTECTKSFYAARNGKYLNGKPTPKIYMHRYILGLQTGDRRQGDHIDRDTLNNQDDNLRVATSSQNKCNKTRSLVNTSGFKGVSWSKRRNRWVAQIQINKKHIFIGHFITAELAHAAYCQAAETHHGDFRRTI